MTDLAIAIHEAGHAVLSRHFGMILECVAVSPACGLSPGAGITKATNQPASNEDRAVVLLGGFVAERQSNQNVDWKCFRENLRFAADRKKVDEVMSCCLSECDDDKKEEELDRLTECARKKAEQLISNPAHWRAIVALSKRLSSTPHQLTGVEAMQIIDAELRADVDSAVNGDLP